MNYINQSSAIAIWWQNKYVHSFTVAIMLPWGLVSGIWK